ncbi:hypothetical protein FOL47_008925 [Perkinsus chesapeaki]|uniref:Centrosomal protein of 44 kDa n=1 Tax=Perkinsus chesapeaki TaxID=330153 RepID=A0A7J6N323_PERCH|nr:hypothetical protein FOL47_008925 [Perkinsus chesapeaki]
MTSARNLKTSQHQMKLVATKLMTALRKCHYVPHDEKFYERLFTEGKPEDLLQLYHFLFLKMSPSITLRVHEKYEEFGAYASDLQFMQVVYKFVRDFLHIKPSLNLQQFFSPGFLLKKVDMAADVADGLRKLDTALSGQSQHTAVRLSKKTPHNSSHGAISNSKVTTIKTLLSNDRTTNSACSGALGDDIPLTEAVNRIAESVDSIDKKIDSLAHHVEVRLFQLETRFSLLEDSIKTGQMDNSKTDPGSSGKHEHAASATS